MALTFQSLTRKKPLEATPADNGLTRCLSAFDLTLLGVGAIIGTGIFVLTGQVAATQAGPAVVLSYVVAGVACAFAALAYAELSAMVGGCGSAYGYSYAAFGEFVAWIIGWDLLLEYGLAVATVANGWSGYFMSILRPLGIDLPAALTKGPFAVDKVTKLPDPGLVNLPAMAIILVLMGLLLMGIRESARLNAAMVFIKFLVIAVFLAVGFGHVNPDLWTPFAPFGWFSALDNGHNVGILAGASVVFFAYVGFDAVSTAVEEAKDPQRDVPRGILASLAICTLLYILVAGVLTGIASYTDLDVPQPVAHAMELLGFNWASAFLSCGVVAGLTAVMLVLYYGCTRILLAMSRDGLVPKLWSRIDEKRHAPVANTVICGLVMMAFAGFFPLHILGELVSVGTLAAFVLVCGGVIVLRLKKPDAPRPFKAPGGLLTPALGILSCGALIAFLPPETHWRFAAWLAVGVAIYFGYSYRHSRLNAGAAQLT